MFALHPICVQDPIFKMSSTSPENSSLGTCTEHALRWITQNPTKENLTLVQVMIWCHQATSHYLKCSMLISRSMLPCDVTGSQWFNTLKPRRNRCHFADDIFKCIFVNENVSITIKISLKFIPTGPMNNYPSLVQKMAWRWPGDKPLLSEPTMG